MSPDDELSERQGDRQLCPRCGREIVFGTNHCPHCDQKTHTAILIEPYQPLDLIRAEAAAYRAAANRPGNRLVLFGMWVLWGPTTLMCGLIGLLSLWYLPEAFRNGDWFIIGLGIIVTLFWTTIGVKLLRDTTRGYLGKNVPPSENK